MTTRARLRNIEAGRAVGPAGGRETDAVLDRIEVLMAEGRRLTAQRSTASVSVSRLMAYARTVDPRVSYSALAGAAGLSITAAVHRVTATHKEES